MKHSYKDLAVNSLHCIEETYENIESQKIKHEDLVTSERIGRGHLKHRNDLVGRQISKSDCCKVLEFLSSIMYGLTKNQNDDLAVSVEKELLNNYMKWATLQENAFSLAPNFFAMQRTIDEACIHPLHKETHNEITDSMEKVVGKYYQHVIFVRCGGHELSPYAPLSYDEAIESIGKIDGINDIVPTEHTEL